MQLLVDKYTLVKKRNKKKLDKEEEVPKWKDPKKLNRKYCSDIIIIYHIPYKYYSSN